VPCYDVRLIGGIDYEVFHLLSCTAAAAVRDGPVARAAERRKHREETAVDVGSGD